MFRLRYAVKFGAFLVCPKCNRPRKPQDQGKHVGRFAATQELDHFAGTGKLDRFAGTRNKEDTHVGI